MSKKHNKNSSSGQPQYNQRMDATKSAEFSIIKKDLVKVIVLNLIFFTAAIVLYTTNQKSHFLDNLFSTMF